MINIEIINNHKTVTPPLQFELPEFTVLTGTNGSGKTHLFEAISNNQKCKIFVDGKKIETIRYIPFNQLNPQIDEQCDPTVISARVKGIWSEIIQAKSRMGNINNYPPIDKPENDPILNYIHNEQNRQVVFQICKRSKIFPSKMSEDDLNDYISMIDLSENNLFNSQFALIFKAYHIQFLDNMTNKYLQEEGVPDCAKYLSKVEFEDKYGKAPWEFVNSILEKLQLPYIVNNPLKTKRDSTFNLKLIHKEKEYEISTNDLSTGEKTLMSLALAIYNTTGQGDRAEMLVLDEPDAPLHPSMSRLMLSILEDNIVKTHGIPVIISTHSPTTIACAPPYSLYKLSGESKRPMHCNLDDSVEILTYGIPNLKVSIENRRQVFVENNNDVEYYEMLFGILSRKYNFDVLLQFLSPHNHNGSNCSDVLNITKALRDYGNTHVYGLIDWDLKNKADNQIVILGMEKRYSIENYVFEPHLLGLYLIKKGFSSPSDFGLSDCHSYLEVCKQINTLGVNVLQIIIDNVEKMLFKENFNINKVNCKLINDDVVQIREECLTKQGHALEAEIKSTWPKINSVRGNGDSVLKKDVISTIINDFPEYLSMDILDTFKEFK